MHLGSTLAHVGFVYCLLCVDSCEGVNGKLIEQLNNYEWKNK
mgnify:CR=1 FL=1